MSPGRSSRPTEDRAVVERLSAASATPRCFASSTATPARRGGPARRFFRRSSRSASAVERREPTRANNGAFEALRGAFLDAGGDRGDVDGRAAAAVLVAVPGDWAGVRASRHVGTRAAPAASGWTSRVAARTPHGSSPRRTSSRPTRASGKFERDHGIAVAPGTVRAGGMRTTRALATRFSNAPGTAFLVAEPHVSSPVELAGDGADASCWRATGWTSWRTRRRRPRSSPRRRTWPGEEEGAVLRARRAPASAAARLVRVARKRRSRDDCVVVAVRVEM